MNTNIKVNSLYHVDEIREKIKSFDWYTYEHNAWLIPYYERISNILEDAQGYLDYTQLHYFMANTQEVYNTYNMGCEIVLQHAQSERLGFVALHLEGDVRVNYTDYFILDSEQYDEVMCIIGEVMLEQETRQELENL